MAFSDAPCPNPSRECCSAFLQGRSTAIMSTGDSSSKLPAIRHHASAPQLPSSAASIASDHSDARNGTGFDKALAAMAATPPWFRTTNNATLERSASLIQAEDLGISQYARCATFSKTYEYAPGSGILVMYRDFTFGSEIRDAKRKIENEERRKLMLHKQAENLEMLRQRLRNKRTQLRAEWLASSTFYRGLVMKRESSRDLLGTMGVTKGSSAAEVRLAARRASVDDSGAAAAAATREARAPASPTATGSAAGFASRDRLPVVRQGLGKGGGDTAGGSAQQSSLGLLAGARGPWAEAERGDEGAAGLAGSGGLLGPPKRIGSGRAATETAAAAGQGEKGGAEGAESRSAGPPGPLGGSNGPGDPRPHSSSASTFSMASLPRADAGRVASAGGQSWTQDGERSSVSLSGFAPHSLPDRYAETPGAELVAQQTRPSSTTSSLRPPGSRVSFEDEELPMAGLEQRGQAMLRYGGAVGAAEGRATLSRSEARGLGFTSVQAAAGEVISDAGRRWTACRPAKAEAARRRQLEEWKVARRQTANQLAAGTSENSALANPDPHDATTQECRQEESEGAAAATVAEPAARAEGEAASETETAEATTAAASEMELEAEPNAQDADTAGAAETH